MNYRSKSKAELLELVRTRKAALAKEKVSFVLKGFARKTKPGLVTLLLRLDKLLAKGRLSQRNAAAGAEEERRREEAARLELENLALPPDSKEYSWDPPAIEQDADLADEAASSEDQTPTPSIPQDIVERVRTDAVKALKAFRSRQEPAATTGILTYEAKFQKIGALADKILQLEKEFASAFNS